MDLVAKWWVYSNDITSEETVLLWDYSTGSEIVCNNNCGCYLWEDYKCPDTRVNILMTNKTLEKTTITFPKFEYSKFPAVSFFLYMQIYTTRFCFGNYESTEIVYGSRNQVSIIGNKVYFNCEDTGEVISSDVANAVESLQFQIKVPVSTGGKVPVTGFYGHLVEE